jgi:AcrR family transcriptional regulator
MINTREDWIRAGLELLKTNGHRSVKVEAMARQMGVSKGGFYGYFMNREAFLQAMLDHWANIFTNQVLSDIDDTEGTLCEKLQKLLYMVDDSKLDSLETPMYAWAFTDPKAQKVVMRVIKERLVFLANLFLDGGFSKEEAENRANMVHHYMAGCKSFRSLLPKSGSPERHAQLDHFIKLVTAAVDQD